jgi:DNA-binding response OmpR family regulator
MSTQTAAPLLAAMLGNGTGTRVLLIEDDPAVAAEVQMGLREHGFDVDASLSGYEGEDLAGSGGYDLIVLDLLLYDRDGVELCRSLRRRGIGAKVLILTAVTSSEDIIKALDAGADDYMTKPFNREELVARAYALLRRGDIMGTRFLRCEDLVLDLHKHLARRGDEPLQLSAREWDVLEYLMRNQHGVLTRAQIGQGVWGVDRGASNNLVNTYVALLRRKVNGGRGGRWGAPELIHTLKGSGYRLGLADENGGRGALAPEGPESATANDGIGHDGREALLR